EIRGHMSLLRKFGFEVLLKLKSRVVRSKPYVHDFLKQPHFDRAYEVGLYSGSLPKNSYWPLRRNRMRRGHNPRASRTKQLHDGIGETLVSNGRGLLQRSARNQYQSIAELGQMWLIPLPRNSGIYPIVGFTVRACMVVEFMARGH